MTNFINVRRAPIGTRVLYRWQLWTVDASYGDGEHCLVRPDGQEVHAYPGEFTRLPRVGFALAFVLGFALAVTSPPLWWWRAMATPLTQFVARLS